MPSVRRPLRSSFRSRLLLLALLSVWWIPATGSSTPTDPTLAISDASALGKGGPRLLRIEGAFQALDLVQLEWPLQILVRETTTGTTYVRFDVVLGPFSGDASELANGLDPADVPGLLAAGTPADGDVVFLGERRLEVLLPVSFPAGPAEVQLFVVDEGDVVLSNPFDVSVGAAP